MDKIIKTYLQIPSERLGVLIDLDFKELHKIEREVKDSWTKNNKCDCVKNLEKDKVLRCEHIQKEKENQTKELKENLRKKCFVSQFRTLIKVKSS